MRTFSLQKNNMRKDIVQSFWAKSHVTIPFALLILAFLSYAQTLDFPFIHDDIQQIVENPLLHSGNFFKIFVLPQVPGNVYRPVVTASFYLNQLAGGMDPFGYRLFNIFLHALNAILVFYCFRFFGKGCALLAAVFYVLHPIHVETITSVFNRSDLLSSFFGFSSLIVLQQKQRPHCRKMLYGLLLLLAVFSKESALVFIVFGLLWIAVERKDKPGGIYAYLTLSLIVLLIYFSVRYSVIGALISSGYAPTPLVNPLIGLPFVERAVNGFYLISKYLELMLLPAGIQADYSFASLAPVSSWLEPDKFLSLLAAAAFAGAAGLSIIQRKKIWLPLLISLLPFLITANLIIPNNVIFACRFAALPAAGISALLAYYLTKIRSGLMRGCLSVAVCLFYFVITQIESRYWKNELTLWTHESRRAPLNAKAQSNLGIALMKQGKYQESLSAVQKSLQIYPAMSDAQLVLQRVLLRLERFDEAEEANKQILKADANNVIAIDGLGWSKLGKKDWQAAKDIFITNTDFESSRIGLVCALASLGLNEEAHEESGLISERGRKDPRFKKCTER
jgi:tetratricopeptide (TPR) repeat protein